MKHWWNDGDREKSTVPGEKPVHEPLFPPHIPRGMAYDKNPSLPRPEASEEAP